VSIDENIKKLNIVLPKAPNPVGAYVAYKKIGNLVFISGQVSFNTSGQLIKGKLGSDLTLEQGQDAARSCAINILSQIKAACNGDLNEVKSCVKITGFVNSKDDFIDQPKVINSASELISSVFGENGKHARAAVSVNSLPLGAAVEIEAIFEIN
jgi:enamine deaminase RidA (YjgF/YER057c/UK114 family)